jgi:hypothetical protein
MQPGWDEDINPINLLCALPSVEGPAEDQYRRILSTATENWLWLNFRDAGDRRGAWYLDGSFVIMTGVQS